MNFQQLKAVREAVRAGYNLTDAAERLFTSQPGVSRQIKELEDELGVVLFVRAGKRLVGLTEMGKATLPLIERLLDGAENLRRVGEDFFAAKRGVLSVAATHSQARYALPPAIRDFRLLCPEVDFRLHQGSPQQVAAMLVSGEADLGVATEALADHPDLITFPCYRWTHSLVVPPGHALLDLPSPVKLPQIAQYPIITYDTGYTGRSRTHRAFRDAGLEPQVVLTAMDADVIKTYVELGMGVGLVASVAVDPRRDAHLGLIDVGHLFEINVTRLAIKKGVWLRGYVYQFIETFVPSLTRHEVESSLSAGLA